MSVDRKMLAISAKYPGRCMCGNTFVAGDRVVWLMGPVDPVSNRRRKGEILCCAYCAGGSLPEIKACFEGSHRKALPARYYGPYSWIEDNEWAIGCVGDR